MSDITFVIFTYNEEKRVPYVIRNFIKYGEVIVMDGGSTDKTKEITEKMGAKFFSRPSSDKQQVETQVNLDFIKNKITTKWIYWGFVDNILPKSLLDKVQNIVKQDNISCIMVPLYSYLYGQVEHPMLKSYNPMFFKVDFIDFTNNIIHEMGRFLGNKREIIKLPNKLQYAARHYSLYDLNKFINGHLRYAIEEAQNKFKRGVKFKTWVMLGAMVRYFFLYYKYSFRNAIYGLITALLYVSFRLMVYAKLYEFENNIDLISIEEKFIHAKEDVLKEF